MKFNWSLINQDKVVVNCRTEEQSKALLNEAHILGSKWESGRSYKDFTHWNVKCENTCYNFKNNLISDYCDIKWYENRGCKILSFEDVLLKDEIIKTLWDGDGFRGIIGTKTNMTYVDGSFIDVGDVLVIKNGSTIVTPAFIVQFGECSGKDGLFGDVFINGVSGKWEILNYTKWYNNKETKIRGIEIKEEKIMKKLNLRKEYKDDKIRISLHTDNGLYNYSCIKMYSTKISNRTNLEIRIGNEKLYDTTLEQANAIIKLMGLNYELEDDIIIEWDKVEVGTQVSYTNDESDLIELVGDFYSYVEKLKKVILVINDDIKAINEDECKIYGDK